MYDLVALLVVRQAEEVGERVRVLGIGCHKLPMFELGVDGSSEALAVVPENRWAIEFGIDADAEHLEFVVEAGVVLLELARDKAEVIAHSDAVIGQRAARIDESHQQRLATQFAQLDLLAVLIGERKIGRYIPGTRFVQRAGAG